MFVLGQIVFDKDNTIKAIQAKARETMRVRFRKLSIPEVELGKYVLCDDLDNLKDLDAQHSTFYKISHHLLIFKTLENYRRFLGAEIGAQSKLDRFFTNDGFRKNYGIGRFPDDRFVSLFIVALKAEPISNAARLVKYVLTQMGGWEIKGWRLRSPVTTWKS